MRFTLHGFEALAAGRCAGLRRVQLVANQLSSLSGVALLLGRRRLQELCLGVMDVKTSADEDPDWVQLVEAQQQAQQGLGQGQSGPTQEQLVQQQTQEVQQQQGAAPGALLSLQQQEERSAASNRVVRALVHTVPAAKQAEAVQATAQACTSKAAVVTGWWQLAAAR